MTEHRWSKFWWQDYEADVSLRLCSLAAQGLWMRMLCVMHRATPYGHFTLNGNSPTPLMLSRLVAISERACKALLSELEENKVFSRTDEGVIFCRRMVRDKEVSDGMREIAKLGGNPEIIRGTVPKEQRIRGYKRSDSPQKTERIFQKKGGHCWWCEVALQRHTPGVDFFQVDHVIAIRDGGTNDEDNLVPACAVCNHKRARYQSATPNPTLTGRTSDPNHLEAEAESEAETDKKEGDAPRSAPLATTTKAGSRLPPGWLPDEPAFEGATPQTLAKFRDYWTAQPGAKGRKSDWQATWRNWCRRDAEQRRTGPPMKSSALSTFDQNEALIRLASETAPLMSEPMRRLIG